MSAVSPEQFDRELSQRLLLAPGKNYGEATLRTKPSTQFSKAVVNVSGALLAYSCFEYNVYIRDVSQSTDNKRINVTFSYEEAEFKSMIRHGSFDPDSVERIESGTSYFLGYVAGLDTLYLRSDRLAEPLSTILV